MLDCIITNGVVIDGTGAPRFSADVGVRNGKIVAIGEITERAKRTVDANGLVVAPGFLDIHTHVDAQVMWDPTLTPSSIHGVTTVIGGNCGFTLAPVNPSSADYMVRMLAAVEGMPVETLLTGLKLDWRTYAEWTSRLEGNIALNCGFLVGHSAIRRLVMGDDWQKPASPEQVDEMAELLDQSLREGAMGFSSSYNEVHSDHLGAPVPSRFAEPDELVRLAGVLKDKTGTVLGFQAGSWPHFSERSMQVMADMSTAAGGRRLNWNALTVGTGVSEEAIRYRLSASERAKKQGGNVYALMYPGVQRPFIVPNTITGFGMLPTWNDVWVRPRAERMKALADPATRRKMEQDLVEAKDDLRTILIFDQMTVASVNRSENKPYEGRLVGDIAAERGCSAVDVWCDLALSEDLKMVFLTGGGGDDAETWKLRAEFWQDERTVIGATDTGAHLDALDTFKFVTDFVGPTVRDWKLMELEEAVHRLTASLADFYGIKDRGRIQLGYSADIVIFDPETIQSGPTYLRADLPGGASRLYGEPIGIDRVMVNGVEVVVEGKVTGATPGTLLRSGVDTVDAF